MVRSVSVSAKQILAIGFGLFLLYAFPGYMSSDSVVQLLESRSHIYTNAHPPIMAAEWTLLDAIVSGPLLMLLAQGAIFLLGLYALLKRFFVARTAAIVASCILLFPPVQTVMGVIWKDTQMAAYLVAAVACLLSERRNVRLAGLGLAAIACAMRYNAFGAVVPLVGLLFVWEPGVRWWKRYAISAAASIAVVLVAVGINHALTVEKRAWTPAFGDIVGVLEYTHDRSDDDLLYVLRGTPLVVTHDIQAHARAIYSPRNSYQVTRGPDRLFDDPKTPEQWAALDRAWRELIASDWGAYFQSRVASFREVLGLSDSPLMAPVWNDFVEAREQADWIVHDQTWAPVQYKIGRAFTWLAVETPLFRPYIYAALALIVLAGFARDRLTLALIASGLIYELSYLPGSGAPDYRYSHWMILTTCIALVLVIRRRMTRLSR